MRSKLPWHIQVWFCADLSVARNDQLQRIKSEQDSLAKARQKARTEYKAKLKRIR